MTTATLSYNDQQWTVTNDATEFEWLDNNYSCDCNRSLLIRQQHGDVIPHLPCGDTIKLVELVINGDAVPDIY